MTAGIDTERRLHDAVDALPRWLHDHILRVEAGAEHYARLHGEDSDRARIAALGHDLLRHKSGPELLALADQYGLVPNDVERATPIMVHGPVAARILVEEYGLADADVLAGIDCHTTARANMAPIEQVLFIADKVEETKLGRDPALLEVRDLAPLSLDLAVLRYLDMLLDQAVKHRLTLHHRTLEARNQLLLDLKARSK